MSRDVYAGKLKIYGKQHCETLREASNWTTEESAYLSRPLVRFPGVVGSKGISFGPTTTTLIGC
jgi:hypothetical protein